MINKREKHMNRSTSSDSINLKLTASIESNCMAVGLFNPIQLNPNMFQCGGVIIHCSSAINIVHGGPNKIH